MRQKHVACELGDPRNNSSSSDSYNNSNWVFKGEKERERTTTMQRERTTSCQIFKGDHIVNDVGTNERSEKKSLDSRDGKVFNLRRVAQRIGRNYHTFLTE